MCVSFGQVDETCGRYFVFYMNKNCEPLNWNDIDPFVKFLINNGMPIVADYALCVYSIIIIISCYPFRDIGRQQNIAI